MKAVEKNREKLGRVLEQKIRFADKLEEETVAEEEEAEAVEGVLEKVTRSVLMNPIRVELFMHLCKHYCVSITTLEQTFRLSRTAIRWHLNKLLEHGYISKANVDSKTCVYYPSKMVEQLEDIKLLFCINQQPFRAVYLGIYTTPGITQKELISNLNMNRSTIIGSLDKLTRYKLITTVTDGKYSRYYPTEVLKRRADDFRSKRGAYKFRTYLLRKLKSERLEPKLIKTAQDYFLVQVQQKGKQVKTLEIYTNPFSSSLISSS